MLEAIIVTILTGMTEADYRRGEHVEQDGVVVSVVVSANVHTMAVRNVSAPPITRFEMYQKSCYNQRVPLGWEHDYEDNIFTAWTDSPSLAIRPGQAAEFSTRVSSMGAVLGLVPVTLGSDQNPKAVVIDEVWGPVAKPRSFVATVALIVGGLAAVHTAVIVTRARRRRRQAVSG